MTSPRPNAPSERFRCGWSSTDPLYIRYHDREWGVPVRTDRRHFEFLILEGMQAGLSWMTVLRKREAFRDAFDDFDPERVARYDARKIRALLANPGIIRNRLKIHSAVNNAQRFLDLAEEQGSFTRYIWSFVGGRPKMNRWRTLAQLPCTSPESDALSADLIRRGFKFVGSTICYSHLQAAGLINDHVVGCFRYRELQRT